MTDPSPMQPPPDEIAWYEGMLLEPEHFTDTALRSQRVLGRHATGLTPYAWGLRTLKLDPAQLVAGIVQVLEVEAILPDGLHVWRRHVQPPDLRLRLTEDAVAALATDGVVTIHLAVPADAGASSNLQGLLPRLIPVPAEATDGEGAEAGRAITIPRLQPNLRLVPGDAPPANHASFPLLKVRLRDNLFVPTDYVPPLLQSALTASVPPLDGPLRGAWNLLAARLREKVTGLVSERRGQAGGKRVDEASQRLRVWEKRLLITALGAGLPELEAMLDAPTVHPFVVYRCLCRVLGYLAAFAEDGQPPRPASYDHNDLNRVFSSLVAQINTLMLLAVPDTHTVVPFEEEASSFRLYFQPAWRRSELLIGLQRRADGDLRGLAEWMRSAVLCSASLLADAKRQRVTGAPHAPFAGDARIAPTGDRLLFHCVPDPAWVRDDELLILVNPGDADARPVPLEAALYVRK